MKYKKFAKAIMEIDNEHGGGICKPLPLDGISGQGVFYTVDYQPYDIFLICAKFTTF
jgi:hypothetical protein